MFCFWVCLGLVVFCVVGYVYLLISCLGVLGVELFLLVVFLGFVVRVGFDNSVVCFIFNFYLFVFCNYVIVFVFTCVGCVILAVVCCGLWYWLLFLGYCLSAALWLLRLVCWVLFDCYFVVFCLIRLFCWLAFLVGIGFVFELCFFCFGCCLVFVLVWFLFDLCVILFGLNLVGVRVCGFGFKLVCCLFIGLVWVGEIALWACWFLVWFILGLIWISFLGVFVVSLCLRYNTWFVWSSVGFVFSRFVGSWIWFCLGGLFWVLILVCLFIVRLLFCWGCCFSVWYFGRLVWFCCGVWLLFSLFFGAEIVNDC